MRAIIVEAFASDTSTQLAERLERAGIANARVNEMADAWSHPQLAALRGSGAI